MGRPTIPTGLIDEQQRIAAMTLIPTEANGLVKRVAAGTANLLGESEGATESEWDVCVFEVPLREGRGRWKAEGQQTEGRSKILMAWPEATEDERDGWEPAIGDLVTRDGMTWRVVGVTTQAVPGAVYWEVDGERL